MNLLLVCRGILAIISYIIVDHYYKKYPKLDANPMLYAIGAFMVSFVICMFCFVYKLKLHKDIEKLFEDINPYK